MPARRGRDTVGDKILWDPFFLADQPPRCMLFAEEKIDTPHILFLRGVFFSNPTNMLPGAQAPATKGFRKYFLAKGTSAASGGNLHSGARKSLHRY